MKARYGEEEGNKLWELINRQYDKYLEDLPDYPPVEELQELVTKLFMSGFVKLGKFFNLNRSFDMWLIKKLEKKIENYMHNIQHASVIYQSHMIKRIMQPDTTLHNVQMQNLQKNII